MHPNEALIEEFYQGFQQKDAARMIACYHPEVVFSDPVFQNLKGDRAKAMWQMLSARAKDLEMTYRDVQADDQKGQGYWEAVYNFSSTNRQVHNKINSAFRFKDGKIIEHIDTFDLWKWASMALGLKGRLLGWSPPVQKAIRAQAIRGLDEYMSRQPVKEN